MRLYDPFTGLFISETGHPLKRTAERVPLMVESIAELWIQGRNLLNPHYTLFPLSGSLQTWLVIDTRKVHEARLSAVRASAGLY